MVNCHEMKKDDTLVCEGCGLVLKVVKECEECGTDASECGCGPCTFVCCDEELKIKKAAD